MKSILNSNDILDSLFTSYESYKEKQVNPAFIKYEELKSLINQLNHKKQFQVSQLGESVEHRAIYSISFGTGKIKVLSWSQMHGNEPTATAAIFDLLKFFTQNDEYDVFRNNLLNKITFYFVPMLNPDGSEKYQRENAFNIDLNRDALKLQSPESKILWDYAAKLEPEFGFNLHDQSCYYTAGRTENNASISLLAPAMNRAKSINYVREKSMQIITEINNTLSRFIPGNIARYSDEFEERAFGDNLTRSGISTILIESGYFKNDINKDFIRKLNFTALLSAFHSIAEETYTKIDYTNYFLIPENAERLFDLLLKNVTIKCCGSSYIVDIGIKRNKLRNEITNEFYYISKINQIGDLSIFNGIEELDMKGYEIRSDQKIASDSEATFKLYKDDIIEKSVMNGFFEN
jgi:Zinc carboxypeptidase